MELSNDTFIAEITEFNSGYTISIRYNVPGARDIQLYLLPLGFDNLEEIVASARQYIDKQNLHPGLMHR